MVWNREIMNDFPTLESIIKWNVRRWMRMARDPMLTKLLKITFLRHNSITFHRRCDAIKEYYKNARVMKYCTAFTVLKNVDWLLGYPTPTIIPTPTPNQPDHVGPHMASLSFMWKDNAKLYTGWPFYQPTCNDFDKSILKIEGEIKLSFDNGF